MPCFSYPLKSDLSSVGTVKVTFYKVPETRNHVEPVNLYVPHDTFFYDKKFLFWTVCRKQLVRCWINLPLKLLQIVGKSAFGLPRAGPTSLILSPRVLTPIPHLYKYTLGLCAISSDTLSKVVNFWTGNNLATIVNELLGLKLF